MEYWFSQLKTIVPPSREANMPVSEASTSIASPRCPNLVHQCTSSRFLSAARVMISAFMSARAANTKSPKSSNSSKPAKRRQGVGAILSANPTSRRCLGVIHGYTKITFKTFAEQLPKAIASTHSNHHLMRTTRRTNDIPEQAAVNASLLIPQPAVTIRPPVLLLSSTQR